MLLMLTCNDKLHLSVLFCIYFASSDRLQGCRCSAHLLKWGGGGMLWMMAKESERKIERGTSKEYFPSAFIASA